ncbi:acyl-CoA thioesterase [Ampullimonas aquatilis]|uniref:acyl-CoA thioesterase n=1 Tax=Ampullimonas aquatilis TaxID=1341549 RepID=UPI003C727B23
MSAQITTVTMPLRWGDMDQVGHVNNIQYFEYIQEARLVLLRQLRTGLQLPTGQGFVLASTQCDFVRELVWPGEIAITQQLVKLGRSSFTISNTLYRTDAPDAICARGLSVIVWRNHALGKAEALPDEIRARLMTFLPDGQTE